MNGDVKKVVTVSMVFLVLFMALIFTMPHVLFKLGGNYLMVAKTDRAIYCYNLAEKTGYKTDKLYVNRGLAWFALKKHEAAESDFRQAIRINPRNPDPYIQLGILSTVYFKYDMAIDFYTQAIELDKQSYQSFSNRGILHVILGNYKLAKDDFTRAIEIKPESPEAIFNFAKFYDQIHQVSLALEYYEKFLKVSEPSMIELLDFANERIIALRALDPTKIPVLPIGVVSKGAKYGMADVSMTFDIESLVNSSTAKQK